MPCIWTGKKGFRKKQFMGVTDNKNYLIHAPDSSAANALIWKLKYVFGCPTNIESGVLRDAKKMVLEVINN